jgi:hypothetical protein
MEGNGRMLMENKCMSDETAAEDIVTHSFSLKMLSRET